jgi:predicted nucleic acid-binding protein
MPKIIMLDAGPLGKLAHPRPNKDLVSWVDSVSQAGAVIAFSAVTDYEVRRDLLVAELVKSIRRLDDYRQLYDFIPLSNEVLLRAAEVWARARKMGRPLADPKRLDADAILLAQTQLLTEEGDDVVIATENVRHLALFAQAKEWSDITP